MPRYVYTLSRYLKASLSLLQFETRGQELFLSTLAVKVSG